MNFKHLHRGVYPYNCSNIYEPMEYISENIQVVVTAP
jgi:hypothetical protein